MQVVDCFGSPTERGRIHGETLRKEITDALGKWETATIKGLGPRAPRNIDTYCTDFLAGTDLMQRAATLTPDLLKEMEGIADGAGQPLARIAAYNLMDEQWWYDIAPDAPPPGCSLVAIPDKGGHVLAQNMDLPGFMDGSQVILRLGGDDLPQTIILSAAGMIGLTGANNAGVAVGVNTLLMLRHKTNGLPVAFALRHALAARSSDDALARLARIPHASGQHYAVVTRYGVGSVECSGTGCVPLMVKEGRFLHTNHPLISEDVDTSALARLDKAGFNASSHERLEWLKSQVIQLPSEVQRLFDVPDAPICMRPATHRGSGTFASVFYEMREDVTIRMAQGAASDRKWQDVCWTNL